MNDYDPKPTSSSTHRLAQKIYVRMIHDRESARDLSEYASPEKMAGIAISRAVIFEEQWQKHKRTERSQRNDFPDTDDKDLPF